MARCRVDSSIGRVEMDGFVFPLGVYPVEEMTPRAGYTLAFEPADGGDEESDAAGGREERGPGGASGSQGPGSEDDDITGGMPDALSGVPGMTPGAEWEEWPDRYVFDILVPANRVEALCRALFALLPGRVYPILDVLGHDEYREVDPYVSYDLLGMDRFIDGIRRYRGFFYEDGLVGFGAMSDEPFLYIFVDEHKIVTVRAEVPLREKIEQILQAFDLEQMDQIAGADSVTHEHRSVLDAPEDRLDLLTPDEIVEDLQEDWRLELNINPETNLDEEGQPLGMTGWRCIVRFERLPKAPEEREEGDSGDQEGNAAESTRSISPAGQLAARAGTGSGEKTSKVAKDGPTSEAAAVPPPSRYAEVLVSAENLAVAQDLALQAVIELEEPFSSRLADGDSELEPFVVVLTSDRLRPDSFAQAVREVTKKKASLEDARVWSARWVA